MFNLYEEVNSFITKYYEDEDHCDFIDKLESFLKVFYPGKEIYIYDYDTDNYTYELDGQLDDILNTAKDHKIIDFCNVWDDESMITILITNKD